MKTTAKFEKTQDQDSKSLSGGLCSAWCVKQERKNENLDWIGKIGFPIVLYTCSFKILTFEYD